MQKEKKIILKVLVGSWAHGLNTEDSDRDYRGVYVLPTSKILSLGFHYKGTDWNEGEEDNTFYEIGHFLQLATKCNPTILEVFLAPVIEANEDGLALRQLFPDVWNTNDAFNAFVGYGLNQRKKFLEDKDKRPNKYAMSYIRVLFNLCELLQNGIWTVNLGNTQIGNVLKIYREGLYSKGEVIDVAEKYINEAKATLASWNYEYIKHDNNLEKVNHFLLNIRRKYWEI